MENNIFKFATKELSQDALICWLINGIKYKEDKKMYKKAEEFLIYIFKDREKNICIDNYDFEILTQYCNIDVLVLVKEKEDDKKVKYALIIEDKKLTTIHDNQLKRYADMIKNRFNLNDENIIKVYYKPYEELEDIQANVILDRKYMLENIFNDSNIDNAIYISYRAYLKEIEETCKNFEKIPLKEWTKNKEIFYIVAKKYNEQLKNDKERMKVVQVRGSTYIDWYGKECSSKKYKDFINGIYLSLNVNYDRLELHIRGEVNKYNPELRKNVEEELIKLCEEEGLTIEKYSHRKGNKTINLITISLSSEIKYKGALEKIEVLQSIINRFMKNDNK